MKTRKKVAGADSKSVWNKDLKEIKKMAKTTMGPSPIPPQPINPMHAALKAILILTLFLATFLASMLPFAVRRCATRGRGRRRIRVFSMLSVFGGGIFLATCLLDLLPDGLNSIRKASELRKSDIGFPIAELLVAVGFLFVLFIEQLTVFAREQNWIDDSALERLISREEALPDSAVVNRVRHLSDEDLPEVIIDVHFDPSVHSTVRAALLVMALSLHAVFEGLSVGMIVDVNVLVQVFFALLLHKTLIGFSLGLRLVQSKMRVSTIILCCGIFAAQVLIGGFGGIAILRIISAGSASNAAMVSGCAQAVACGTFLYITCFEILPHELNQRGLRLLKLLCLMAGFALICVMIAVLPDEDDSNLMNYGFLMG